MCQTCWEDYGSPKIVNADVLKTSKLIGRIYDYNSVGGNLHIVVDDWNLENDSIDWCIKEALPSNVHEASDAELATELETATLFRKLPLKQRASALAIYDGYFAPQPDIVKERE